MLPSPSAMHAQHERDSRLVRQPHTRSRRPAALSAAAQCRRRRVRCTLNTSVTHVGCASLTREVSAQPPSARPPQAGYNARDQGLATRSVRYAHELPGAGPVTTPGLKRRHVRGARASCTPRTGQSPRDRPRPRPATMLWARGWRHDPRSVRYVPMSSRGAACVTTLGVRPRRVRSVTCAMHTHGGGRGRALVTASAQGRRQYAGPGVGHPLSAIRA